MFRYSSVKITKLGNSLDHEMMPKQYGITRTGQCNLKHYAPKLLVIEALVKFERMAMVTCTDNFQGSRFPGWVLLVFRCMSSRSLARVVHCHKCAVHLFQPLCAIL